MRFAELLDALPADRAALVRRGGEAGAATPVRGLCIDSRRVAPGDLFVALRGSRCDGHDFLGQAIELGAAALLVEELPEAIARAGRPAAIVADSRRSLAPLAAHYYGDPGAELTLIGVTGTNGKTSTTYLTESILRAAGQRCGVIGTIGVHFNGERQRAANTTPESLELQRLLRTMRNRGLEAVAMEVSSHGLAMGRVDGCRFTVAAFTNLSQDHLDLHETMEQYCETKLRLFREHTAVEGTAVIYLGDPHAPRFVAAARRRGLRVIGVARAPRPDADLALHSSAASLAGLQARLVTPQGGFDIEAPLIGDVNLENLLVASGIAWALGVDPDAIAAGLADCPQIPGRFERVDPGGGDTPTVLVDYAHTPDALDRLLAALRPLATGRLIAVFGCGGDRDRDKRAPMARAVARYSDRAVLTSDNPRREDPARILADVERGLEAMRRVDAPQLAGSAAGYAVCPDRRHAIELALAVAAPEDTVVIAGKGHEDYQLVGDVELPFDDRAEARRCLAERRGGVEGS